MRPEDAGPLQFVVKASARCNLDCSYCYVFNRADHTWRTRSPAMSDEVFGHTLTRISRWCRDTGQDRVRLMFHGGEPLLVGPTRFARWLDRSVAVLAPATVAFALQTNGTLVTDEWAALLADRRVEVGVSLDGPPELHDRARVDHAGRGSYDAVLRGIERLRRRGIPLNLLTVIPLGADGAEVYRHFAALEPSTVNLLFPDQNHDDIAEVRHRYGPTPLADFLVPVADEWWARGGTPDVPLLRNVCRLVLGGRTRSDMFGNPPFGFVFVEVDGEIEGLDVLRMDREGLASTGLSVGTDDFASLAAQRSFHADAIFRGLPLPTGCRACPERATCSGGYLPHRWSEARGFDNPSAGCEDILLLFAHLRGLLDVDWSETELRRSVLAEPAWGRG